MRDESLVEVNARAIRLEGKGVGRWRRVYLELIAELAPKSVVEFGGGSPKFLTSIDPAVRRMALDCDAELSGSYAAAGIEFRTLDFDRDQFPDDLADFDVAVCSDVFEHLVFPMRTLDRIVAALRPQGILFSHVPNEFRMLSTLRVLLGARHSVYFHEGFHEWNDPHIRRFTDVGYREFLGNAFQYNLKLTDLAYRIPAKLLRTLRLPVPFGLEGGPTYASTNDEATHRKLVSIKRGIRLWSRARHRDA